MTLARNNVPCQGVWVAQMCQSWPGVANATKDTISHLQVPTLPFPHNGKRAVPAANRLAKGSVTVPFPDPQFLA